VSRRRLLCLVTDRRRLTPGAASATQIERLIVQTRAAAQAGVDLIQIRERDLHTRGLLALVDRLMSISAGTTSKVLVNDRLDVALAAGAAGVHLRGDSFAASRARELGGSSIVIGRSVHSVLEAVETAREGSLDYVILGTAFPTNSKPLLKEPIGPGELARAAAAVAVPVLAIGGVALHNIEMVARAGAGAASIGLFIPSGVADLETHVATMVQAVRRTFDSSGIVSYH